MCSQRAHSVSSTSVGLVGSVERAPANSRGTVRMGQYASCSVAPLLPHPDYPIICPISFQRELAEGRVTKQDA